MGFLAFCFAIAIAFLTYSLSPILFWIIMSGIGFILCLICYERPVSLNRGSHWSDGS